VLSGPMGAEQHNVTADALNVHLRTGHLHQFRRDYLACGSVREYVSSFNRTHHRMNGYSPSPR
jgi:hypothetical protein